MLVETEKKTRCETQANQGLLWGGIQIQIKFVRKIQRRHPVSNFIEYRSEGV